MSHHLKNLLTKSIFFILPLVFVVVALLIHFGKGKFYLTAVDPEYFHLFNGLNIAIFNLSVDFIHHPGTTLQFIFAIAAPIVNLIQPGNSLIENAMNNPEEFIHGAGILLILITGSALLLLGLSTYRYSGNIFYALLLQLMPFGSYKLILISGRLIPETAIIAPVLLLALVMIRYLYDEKRESAMRKYLIAFAIAGGLGVAGKLIYVPFLVIPLFFIPTLKFRLKYLAYTTLAIVVFAFPVFVHFGKSWEWFGGMFLHSGKWGGGELNVFDIQTAPAHLKAIFHIDKIFFFILGLATLQLLVFYIMTNFREMKNSKLNLQMLLGVVVASLFSILLVTKHYEAHYFYPTLLFKAFILFLMTKLVVDVFNTAAIKRLIPLSMFIVMFLIVVFQKEALSKDYQNSRNNAELFADREMILKQYDTFDNTLIITSHYRGSPFIESAMVAGVLMSGHLKTTFLNDLRKMYPNTVFYYDWSDRFYFWDEQKSAGEFVDVNKPVYIFIGEGKEAGLDVIVERLKTAFPAYQTELKILHHFTQPEEYFYELRFTKIDD